MGPGRIADQFQARHLQTLDREGLEVGAAQRPRRPIYRCVTILRYGQHQQLASWCHETSDVEGDCGPQPYRQGLRGVRLHHKVEMPTPLGWRIQ